VTSHAHAAPAQALITQMGTVTRTTDTSAPVSLRIVASDGGFVAPPGPSLLGSSSIVTYANAIAPASVLFQGSSDSTVEAPVLLPVGDSPDATQAARSVPVPLNDAGYTLSNLAVAALGGAAAPGQPVSVSFQNSVMTWPSPPAGTGSISGQVFVDEDDDFGRDATDTPLAGVELRLTGTGAAGDVVDRTAVTAADGSYRFDAVPVGAAYIVAQVHQPAGLLDGFDARAGFLLPASDASDAVPGIAVADGAESSGNDFSESRPVTLAGTVYEDRDGSGTLGAGDIGLGGVALTLRTALVPEIARVVTAADGSYRFTADALGRLLPRDTYIITEAQPAGYLSATNSVGTVGGVPVGSVLPFDVTDLIALGSGDAGVGYDFGEARPVSVTGSVFLDGDGDALRGPGEAGMGGVAVTLLKVGAVTETIMGTTLTAANGSYGFGADLLGQPLGPGAYRVARGLMPAGYEGAGAASFSWSMLSGQEAELEFAAWKQVGSVSGHVYVDLDGNRLRDASDTPLAGVELLLTGTGTSGETVAVTAVTAADGSYRFDGVPVGRDFTVTQLHQPDDYFDGHESRGGLVLEGSDATDEIPGIVVTSRDESPGNDFGEVKPVSLAGTVYVDQDSSGDLGAGDVGLGGVTLLLLDLDALVLVATTTTAEDGSYAFTRDDLGNLLLPSRYQIIEYQPDGYAQGFNAAGTVRGVVTGYDAPGDVITGIALSSGDDGIGYNFGESEPIEFYGRVYEDKNDNGAYDPGEPGIPGVWLYLFGYDQTGEIIAGTALTDDDGAYSFVTDDFGNLLPAGTYSIFEEQPADFLQGTVAAGSIDGAVIGLASAWDSIDEIILAAGQVSVENTFGEVKPVNLAGTVYDDTDGSNDLGPGDLRIGGVSLFLINAATGLVVASTLTAEDGTYGFATDDQGNPLRPGVYQVAEVQPDGFLQGRNTPGTVNGTRIGVAAPGDVITGIALVSGDDGIGYDFGESDPVELHGHVFEDKDGDGVPGPGEPGIPGVWIHLFGYDNQGTPITSRVLTTDDGSFGFITDDAGNLLPAGTYRIVEAEQPAGYLQGGNIVGTVNGAPRGVAGPWDSIDGIALASGQVSVGNAFGEVKRVTIAGTVFNDKDGSPGRTRSTWGSAA
jgi:hypothetical protein